VSGVRAAAGRASRLLAGAAGRTAAITAGLAAVLALPAGASAAAATAAPAPIRAVMIVLDVNQSMSVPTFVTQRRLVAGYVHALPADVRAGLITFDDTWHRALWPTANRARFAAALAAVHRAGVTSSALSPALANAEAVLRAVHPATARMVVLSNAEGLVGTAYTAPFATDVVAWHHDRDDNIAALQALATGSRGRLVSPAQALSLAGVFQPLPATPAPAAAPGTGHRALLTLPLAVPLLAVFAALVLAALMALGTLSVSDRGKALAEHIERYGPRHAPPPPEGEGKAAGAALRWMSWLLQARGAERGLAERLDRAGIARKPAEWALLCVCACMGLAALLTLVMGNVLLGLVAGVPVGWLVMRLVLVIRADRRRAAFGEQLPNVLQLIASSLQSGFSLAQSLDSVVREDQQPTAGEFARALTDARLGANLEDGLDAVADRMASDDLRWVVMAVRIQREVGGNLAEVLRNTVGTMRERAHLRGHVRALTAEGRLSAYILVALPVLVGGWLFYSSPGYMRLLYTTSIGLLMLIGAAVLVVIGTLWMRALIKVEV
jgi:Flp pilus assembly protein TadB